MTSQDDPITTKARTNVPQRRMIQWVWIIPVIMLVAGIFVYFRKPTPDEIYRDGHAAVLGGERATALRCAEQLLQTKSHQAQGYLLKGLCLSRTGKPEEAVTNLQKAAENEALAAEAYTAIARCYYQSGGYLHAIDAAGVALKHDSTSLEARRWRASAYYDLGAMALAIQELETISDADPTDSRPDRLLGLIAKDNEQYDKAVGHYRKSLERAPHQLDKEILLIELAETLTKLDRYEEAYSTLQSCKPSAASLTLEAACLVSLGRSDEAEAKLNKAVKQDVRYVPAKLALGKLELDRGDAASALSVLADATKLEPQNREIHFQLAQAHRATGNTIEADAELARALEILKWEREFSELHDQAASQPNDAEIRYRTGELANVLGKPQLALMWFRAAIAIDPRHSRAHAEIKDLMQSGEMRAMQRR